MTTLSDRLHAAADQLPASLPPAAQVRRHAAVRRRRSAALTTAIGLVMALAGAGALALVVDRTDFDRTTLVPAVPAPPDNVITDEMERRAVAGTYTPLADPFLTEQDWVSFTGHGVFRVEEPVGPLDLLGPCQEEPSGADLQSSRSAQWREPAANARLVETVLTYTDAEAASASVAALLESFHRCMASLQPGVPDGPVPSGLRDPYSPGIYQFPPQAVPAGGFVIERGPYRGPDGPVLQPYQLGVARDGNIVVLVESTGWGDRTSRTLDVALSRALGNQGGRCDIAGLDHRLVECPDRYN
jgi:hypothetical protein